MKERAEMKPDRIRTMTGSRKSRPWPRLSVLLFLVVLLPLFPPASFGADIEVMFEEIAVLNGGTGIYPGEEIQVRVRLRVLRAAANPFAIRLRIAGDGWYEAPDPVPLAGTGERTVTFGPLQAPAAAGPGKVSLLADILATQATVSLLGRRHAYLDIRCPPRRPSATKARLQVGTPPGDMALTADGRYLYVTRDVQTGLGDVDEPKVTVIDVDRGEVVPTDLEDSEAIQLPAGVAADPVRRKMYISDAGLKQVLHVVDAESHVLEEPIDLNPAGDLGPTALGDVAVNPARNEVYIADSRGQRILVVDLTATPPAVRTLSLSNFPLPPAGMLPIQVMLDPDNPRWIYVLCQGMNEVIKLDVVSGAIVDFVQLRNLQDPASLWPAWSMALNPVTDEIYVVVNPGEITPGDPVSIRSKIYILPKNWLGGPRRKGPLLLGSSIWELAVREDGRFVYAIDSYRGAILVIDMQTGKEMSRCAIRVEPGGRFLRADPAPNRLFVGGLLAGFVDIVE